MKTIPTYAYNVNWLTASAKQSNTQQHSQGTRVQLMCEFHLVSEL